MQLLVIGKSLRLVREILDKKFWFI